MDLKAQTLEMACEGEYDSDEESLKVEKRELSVLDVFQKIMDYTSVLYDKYWESLQLTVSLSFIQV